jgi:hypothetical protein
VIKVGDLVKVYNFTRRARESTCFPTMDDARRNAHFIGVITAGHRGNYRKVIRCDSREGVTDLYNVDRLEVINAGR